jgi:hypothetical protein
MLQLEMVIKIKTENFEGKSRQNLPKKPGPGLGLGSS